jgi:hypothetical protein
MSSMDILQGKRIGIMVGINSYMDIEIPKLSGAENDSKELFKLLVSKGKFENNEKYLLLGKSATQRTILELVSEIFRHDDKCELALFYFSGHGFIDKRGELYLSTYDVKKNDPYIGGIKVSDLKNEIYSSENKKNALLILDCCYSGTATKDTKEGDNNIKNIEPYFQKNIGGPVNESKEYGQGKFTIASSATDQVSWETHVEKHTGYNQPHTHGAFTYNLLQGLEGGAADEKTGIITLGSLQQYIDIKMAEDNKQRSFVNKSQQESNINKILIALSEELYVSQVKTIENELFNNVNNLTLSFPNILNIVDGAKKLKELKEINPNNELISNMTNSISNLWNSFCSNVMSWLYDLNEDVKTYIERKTETYFIMNLIDYMSKLESDLLVNIDKNYLTYLMIFGNESKNKNVYNDIDDPKLNTLLRKLEPIFKKDKLPKENLNERN